MAGADHSRLPVYDGAVQRVEHGADQLPGGAGREAAVAVQRQQIAQPGKGLGRPRHPEGAGPSAAEAGQLQQGAPFALPAGPLLSAELPGPGKEEETPAAAPVQRRDSLPGGLQQLLIPRRRLRTRRRQIQKQAEEQVFPLPPTGHAQLLQPSAESSGGLPVGQQGGDDAEGPARPGNAAAQIHPGQGLGRAKLCQQKVSGPLREGRQRHGQQQRGGKADAERRRQQQGEGQQQLQQDRQPRPPGTRFGKQQRPHVDLPLLRPLDQLSGAGKLLPAAAPGKALHPGQIVPAGGGVHPGIVPAGIPAEHRVAEVRLREKLLRIQHGKETQGAEEGLQSGGAVFRPGSPAELPGQSRQLSQSGTAQGGGKETQLRPAQGTHPLKAGQEEGGALLVDPAPPRQQQGPGQGQDQRPLRALAQVSSAREVLPRAQRLPAGKIGVVQQPFPGGRQGHPRRGPPLQQGAAAPQLPPAAAQSGQEPACPALAFRRQQPCRRLPAGGELVVFNIGRVQNAVHGLILRSIDLFP